MGAWNDSIEEARVTAHHIEDMLAQHTDLLNQIANLPPKAVSGSGLRVMSAPELRSFDFATPASGAATYLFTVPPGMYMVLNHWAVEQSAEGFFKLWFENGRFSEPLPANLDILDMTVNKNTFSKGDPTDLVLTPNMNIYASSEPNLSGEVTMSLVRFELST